MKVLWRQRPPARSIGLSDFGDAPALYAGRAQRAYTAMQRRFCTNDGLYRRDGLPRRPGAAAHLWPFARALAGTLDLAGVPSALVPDFDADAAIAQRLAALERYWEPAGDAPAYSSDIVGTRFGGDRYYDDNAWVGLALIQLQRLRPGAAGLERAAELFRFAVTGWDPREDVPSPGGVFWVEQGRGVGAGNHDRNTVSNAPNAELGLHLAELTGTPLDADRSIGVQDMYGWVNATLGAGDPAGDPATGLFFDKLRSDHTVDRTLWSYNQGSMIGANVLLQRRRRTDAHAPYLARAEAIARKALAHYAGSWERQPAAFNAIFFRNLLLLHAATGDTELRTEILTAMHDYADRAWDQRRDQHDRFHFPNGGVTLLGQSAMVQVLALLAWNPEHYHRLA
jgi:Glycosyl hydrolase family 76